ncbi:MAG TPA: hypothetical protein VNN73_15830 [Blastocatellia bacterium]|nr:hypothetical protein [Blastocatellia bacterium]
MPDAGKEAWCGLNSANAIHQTTDDINFAIKFTSGKKASVVENGVTKTKFKYKAGNVFRIAVESGVVNYYRNGSLIYTSSNQPDYPLLVNASLVNTMATVSNVMPAGASVKVVVSISPAKVNMGTGQSLQFTALVTGGSTNAVNWSATRCTISSTGLYTAPSVAGTYKVSATSVSDPKVSAPATVIVSATSNKTPPAISAVTSFGVSATGVTISWITDEPSDTLVEYGTTTSYGSIAEGDATLYQFDPVNFRISNKRELYLTASPAGGLNTEDSIWSGIDSDVIFGHTGMKLYSYNVATNSYTLVERSINLFIN